MQSFPSLHIISPKFLTLGFASLALAGCIGGPGVVEDGHATGGAGFQSTTTVWKTGTIKVFNPHPFPVTVCIDGNRVGYLDPFARAPTSVLQGEHTVSLIAPNGVTVCEYEESTDDSTASQTSDPNATLFFRPGMSNQSQDSKKRLKAVIEKAHEAIAASENKADSSPSKPVESMPASSKSKP